ncbi:hypothetical protein AAG906_021214 [Vitis piasezkii]
MDLHCVYHQGLGHETNRCTALRHAIHDMIDQGLVHLGQPSVTTNPLSAHTTHAVPSPTDSMHSIDFAKLDDHIHMLSWDESEPEPIVSDEIHEIGRVTLGPRMSTPFRLILEAALEQTTTIESLTFTHYSTRMSFVLVPDRCFPDSASMMFMLGCAYPLTTTKPLEGTSSHEEVRREDDEILRQL